MLSLRIYHRIALLLIILLLIASTAFGSAQIIICGWQPGEIYFIGFHSAYWGYAGFYYSSDYGENIELRDSIVTENDFGALLADAEGNTIHRLLYGYPYYDHLLSQDGGFSWEVVNGEITACPNYASGVIPGEVYRQKEIPYHYLLERSSSFGVSYDSCLCLGFPDTLGMASVALGVDSGEVYIWAQEGNLYYSSDYAEHFTYLGNLNQSAGIMCYSLLTNGAEQGEIYAFYHDYKKIWRIYDYGARVEVIADFPHGISWYCSIASGREPGEVYFYAVNADFYPGGVMEIWHTNNYGQDWDMYEHVVQYNGVERRVSPLPSNEQLQIYPNPANPSFTIEYNLPLAQSVELNIYTLMGQQLWQCQPGFQLPGKYQIFFDGENFPSGMHVLTLQTNERRWCKKITLLK